MDERIRLIEFEEAEVEQADDAEAALRRDIADRRQRASLGCHQIHVHADFRAQFVRQLLANDDPRRLPLDGVQRLEAADLHRLLDVGHFGLEPRNDPFDGHETVLRRADDHPLPENRRRRAGHPRHLLQAADIRVVVGDAGAADLEHVDVRRGTDDAIAQFPLQAGHERERDEQRHDTDHDAESRDQRDERDEGLFAPGQQVTDRDEQLERQVHASVNAKCGMPDAESKSCITHSAFSIVH